MSGPAGPWDDAARGAAGSVEAAAERRKEVRRALIDLVRSHRDVVDDDERLDGYLRDICPHQPAEVSVMVVAARAGVADALTRATDGHAVEAVTARLASRLLTESGIDPVLARWAVDSWAIALGRVDASSVSPADAGASSPPPPVDPPRPKPKDEAQARTRTRQPAEAAAGPPAGAAPVPQHPHRSPRFVAAVTGAVTLLVIAAVVALNRDSPKTVESGPLGAAAPTTIGTTSPPTTATTTTASTSTIAPKPFPGKGVAVPPGFYATTNFQPRFTATLDGGWKVNLETADDIELGRADGGPELVSVVKPVRPLRRDQTFPKNEQARLAGSAEATPSDAIAWLRSNSRLSVSSSTPVTRAGVPGFQVDVTLSSPYVTDYCAAPCVPLFQIGESTQFSLVEGNKNHVYSLTVAGAPVLIVIETPPELFAAFSEKVDRLIATMAFTA